MSPARKRNLGIRLFLLGFVLAVAGFLLQNVPGTYTLEKIEERVGLDSVAGQALTSLGRVEVNGRLYFDRDTRHRISRNAEIEVPAETWLKVYAVMVPVQEGEEWVLRPSGLNIVADQPLTFIYRAVTVARARTLRLNEEGEVEAVGRYQVLSALWTGHRYHRQRAVRRAYEIPDLAQLSLSVALLEVEPMVNRLLLGDVLPSEFDVGNAVTLKIDRLHHLQFLGNHLDVHVDGTLSSARSRRVARVIQPSFRSRLGVDLHLPRDTYLDEAALGVSLRNVHTFNISGLNPLFDKLIRDAIRARRDQAAVLVSAAEDFPGVLTWPGELFIEEFSLRGEGGDDAEIQLRIHWKTHKEPGSVTATG